MKNYLLLGSLGFALSTSALACGGVILLDGEPSGSPDGGASTPSPSTPTPSPSTPSTPSTPTPGACTDTPTTLATLAGRKAIGLSLGTGFVAVLADIRGASVPPVAPRDVHLVPIGNRQAPRILGTASPLSDGIEARDQRVYFAQGTGPNSTSIVEHDVASGKTRSVSAAVGPFALTGSDLLVATADTRSLPPQSTITAFTLGPFAVGPRTIATYVGETTSLSARSLSPTAWGAVLSDGRVAQAAFSGGPPLISRPRGARGPARLTALGFVVHERLTCAGGDRANCNQARVSFFPSLPSPSLPSDEPTPMVTSPYTEEAFTTIQAFFADDLGAVFHAAVASGEEIRAREAIVTLGAPSAAPDGSRTVGGAFTTRVADTGRPATAITADTSCIYWTETDASDPTPGAEYTLVRMVKR
jgi:hypothetical protein